MRKDVQKEMYQRAAQWMDGTICSELQETRPLQLTAYCPIHPFGTSLVHLLLHILARRYINPTGPIPRVAACVDGQYDCAWPRPPLC